MKNRDTDKVVDLEDLGLRYRVRILIKHPSEDLNALTLETALAPKLLFTKGAQRFAPNGVMLPGTHAASTWSYWEDFRDSRAFSNGVRSMLDALAPASDSINRLVDGGGEAMLILEFQGHRNIGDAIDRCDLVRMAELGLELGIEVYPNGLRA